jgi:hypothetical protein
VSASARSPSLATADALPDRTTNAGPPRRAETSNADTGWSYMSSEPTPSTTLVCVATCRTSSFDAPNNASLVASAPINGFTPNVAAILMASSREAGRPLRGSAITTAWRFADGATQPSSDSRGAYTIGRIAMSGRPRTRSAATGTSGLRDRPRADPARSPRAVRCDLRARPALARRQARSAPRARARGARRF